MTKAKMLGGALIGAAMAVSGCAGNATGVETAQLDQSVVESSIDGRTDLFLDPMLSTHLLTADEVNGSPTAVAVEVQVDGDHLYAWRQQSQHAPADMVADFQIVGTVDLGTAQTIDNETHPGDPSVIVIPGGALGGLRGGRTGSTVGSRPPFQHVPSPVGLIVNWGIVNGIPNAVDVSTLHSAAAHPGCA